MTERNRANKQIEGLINMFENSEKLNVRDKTTINNQEILKLEDFLTKKSVFEGFTAKTQLTERSDMIFCGMSVKRRIENLFENSNIAMKNIIRNTENTFIKHNTTGISNSSNIKSPFTPTSNQFFIETPLNERININSTKGCFIRPDTTTSINAGEAKRVSYGDNIRTTRDEVYLQNDISINETNNNDASSKRRAIFQQRRDAGRNKTIVASHLNFLLSGRQLDDGVVQPSKLKDCGPGKEYKSNRFGFDPFSGNI